jgi:hypothetical protein
MKRFRKAANKLEASKMIISGFPKSFYVLEIGFQNSFITTSAGFQHGFGPIMTFENLRNPLINL